ncbi:hypothetical protein ABIE09_001827 [Lysobacter enzymogenes]|uniref:hypothetical protein n=1 Tax=Lysobacter enzymogenes TaxID=69 RepID=UPI0033946F3F
MSNVQADTRVSLLPLSQLSVRSAENQQMSAEEFHLIVIRLHELDGLGVVSISDAKRESYSGLRQWEIVFFTRLR